MRQSKPNSNLLLLFFLSVISAAVAEARGNDAGLAGPGSGYLGIALPWSVEKGPLNWEAVGTDSSGLKSARTESLLRVSGETHEFPTLASALNDLEVLTYIASYPDLIRAFGINVEAGRNHWINFGFSEGRKITFKPLTYVATYPDLMAAFGLNLESATKHFITNGFNEGRKPTFDSLAYIASHADLIKAFRTDADAGARHYINWGYREGRAVAFDGLNYIASYGDLIAAFGADRDAGSRHYINWGFLEKRQITFEPLVYIASHGDLIDAFGADAEAGARHYITWGFKEGRAIAFNGLAYIASYPDLIVALGADAAAGVLDYIKRGYKEGRQVIFDVGFYLSQPGNIDVRAAVGANSSAATVHYINHGYREGRVAFANTSLSLSESSLNFGTQFPGALGLPRVMMLRNAGAQPLTALSLSISGPQSTDFSFSSGCGSSILPGTSCRITVRFSPSSDGAKSATLVVAANNASQNLQVSLSGLAPRSGAVSVPGTPIISSYSGGDGRVTLDFLPPDTNGGANIGNYSATCAAGTVSRTATGGSTPLVMEGLTNGTVYSCYLTAVNSAGASAPSASVAVMPRSRTAGNPSIDYVFAISGKIIDGYISGATVYVDMNWSLAYEPGEPKAVTDANGDWRFTVDDLKNFSCYKTAGDPRPILAEVPAGAVDSVRGVVKSPFKLVFLPSSWLGVTTDIGFANVTPFTTLFASAITESVADSTGSTSSSISVGDACGTTANAIASRVRQSAGNLGAKLRDSGINLATFYDDFIATRNITAQRKGEFIVDFLARTQLVSESIISSIQKEVGNSGKLRANSSISYEAIKEIINSDPRDVLFDLRVDSTSLQAITGERGNFIFIGEALRMRSDGAVIASTCAAADPFACTPVTVDGVDAAIKSAQKAFKATRINAPLGYRYSAFGKGRRSAAGKFWCENTFSFAFGVEPFNRTSEAYPKSGVEVSELKFIYNLPILDKIKYGCDEPTPSSYGGYKIVAFPPRSNGYFWSRFGINNFVDNASAKRIFPYLSNFVDDISFSSKLFLLPFDSAAAYEELNSLSSNPKNLDDVAKKYGDLSWYFETGSYEEKGILFKTFQKDGVDIFRCTVTDLRGSNVRRDFVGTRDQARDFCYPDLSAF
jgi:hypothetical protein